MTIARADRGPEPEGVELLERDAGDPRLLLQLAAGTDVEILILLDEPARQGPLPWNGGFPRWINRISRRSSRIVKITMSVVMVNVGMRNFAIFQLPPLLSSGFQFSGREIWRCYLQDDTIRRARRG